MEISELLHEIEASRIYGVVELFVYQKPTSSKWEEAVIEYFPMAGVSAEIFKESLIEIASSKLDCDILVRLLHQDLAYDVEIMPLKKATSFANRFFSIFSSEAAYFSNSTWNKNEYSTTENNFEFGLSSWTSLTDATFDSGIIVCDGDRIGIAWFADED